MPISEFQVYVLKMLRDHRNPNSYVAGGIAINRGIDSQRLSNDIDLFHDMEEAVSASATADIKTLRDNGCKVEVVLERPSFWRAVVTQRDQSLKLEWVRDTAFRFYPVIEDDILGYRLHDIDLAINKCLALANRNEVRDIIDLIHFHEHYVPLTTACWAACGKDPGFTPEMIIDHMRRNSIIRPEQLAAESMTKKLSAPELKMKWLKILTHTEEQLKQLPAKDLGCLYLDKDNNPASIKSNSEIQKFRRHFGTIGGSWPLALANN